MQFHAQSLPQSQVSIFETVRNVPLNAVIQRYVDTEILWKSGHLWILCPFHQDKNPSLSIKGQYWKCFGCGAGGDGVEFVARLHNLPKVQAAKQIAEDFGLPANTSKQQRQQIATAKLARQRKKTFDAEVERAYQDLCDVRIECCKAIDSTGEYGLRYAFVPDMLDTYLDILQFGTDAEKREFLASGVVQRWVSKMLGRTRPP
ncbi:DNA primase [Peptococcaceae bacterium CEB3]|nr:DNA primase [Peptococcaceae bacterium CEB3]